MARTQPMLIEAMANRYAQITSRTSTSARSCGLPFVDKKSVISIKLIVLYRMVCVVPNTISACVSSSYEISARMLFVHVLSAL